MTISTALFVDSVRQRDDGGLDLCGLSEGFGFPSVPVTLEQVPIFLNLELDPDDYAKPVRLAFHLLAPSGGQFSPENTLEFTLPTDTPTAKLLPAMNLTFHHFGIHTLEIRLGETLLQRLHLTITQQGLKNA